MTKRILVPLDRRETGQGIVPLVGDLARSSGATVRLLHIAPIPEGHIGDYGRVITYASQEMDRLTFQGLDYLKTAEAQLERVPVESVVRFGDPVEEIVSEAEAFGADLIALETSRRRWPRRFGGVANRIVRKVDIPVIVLGMR